MRILLANGLFWGNLLVACLSLGVLMVGVGFGTRWRRHILALMPGHHLSLVSYFFMACGLVLLSVASFGVAVSWKLRRKERTGGGRGARGCAVYNAMAIIVIFNVLFCSYVVYHYVTLARVELGDDLKYAMYQYFVDASSRDKLDNLHRDFKCCGVSNYTDWTTATTGAVLMRAADSASKTFVPRTCCVVETSDGACFKYHEQGCRDLLTDYFNMLLPSIIFCVICVVVWLLCLVLTSARLRRTLLEESK
ncbi:CD63 antigen-like [Ixodes scapularis]|uniref:CD63 antigen-like n=1 Tax=Ixodes scapularis TaxID=6945 RepID=UPI001A9CD28A|nr:CD63 antigen-like [Ixodes scapularis]